MPRKDLDAYRAIALALQDSEMPVMAVADLATVITTHSEPVLAWTAGLMEEDGLVIADWSAEGGAKRVTAAQLTLLGTKFAAAVETDSVWDYVKSSNENYNLKDMDRLVSSLSLFKMLDEQGNLKPGI